MQKPGLPLCPQGQPTVNDLPVGGSTGLSHEHSAAIEQAALFLALTPPFARPAPLVPALLEMFGLSSSESCQAICDARELVHR